MKRFLSLLLVVLMAFTLCLAGCGESNDDNADTGNEGNLTKEDIKAAFLYVGPIGDLGYSYAHDQGRLALEAMGITTHYVENVPESSDCEATLRQLCDEVYNVIYATSFGHGEWVEKVAKDYPDVYFGHATGYITGDNVGNYMGRVYEARYLAGIVAGLNSESGKVGYVAAMPIAEVIRGINAFTLGLRSVNPDATVEVIWTNTWFDVTLERNAALELINKGCDVIAQHCDSTAPQVAAGEKGVLAIGYNSSTPTAAPDAYLTAPLFHWDVYYKQNIEAIINGTWKGESYWEGLSAGMVSLDTLTDNCAEGTAEAVAEAEEAIKSGELKIFAGELKDNTGAVRVEAGAEMTDAELQSFDWLVEGVIGSIN
ncbi:MAG: BMP family ABC transporter substrate-binding protein [Clostridia bacterium]|nr:BMP family ABC transporter substrate-binding protein [Clostridia bacterium]